MSSAKSDWQQAILILSKLLANKQLRRYYGQAFCFLIVVLLWWTNWKLFLATGVGISLMSCYYFWQYSTWQHSLRKWRRFLAGSNRQLLMAVGLGSSGAFLTYLGATVWAEAESQWLATGFIIEGILSLATLTLLFWSLKTRKVDTLEAKLEQLYRDLCHSSHLRRLMAIRQLTRLMVGNQLPAQYYWESLEYYHLMLNEPQPTAVKNALLEGLDLLQGNLEEEFAPINIPLQLDARHKPLFDQILREDSLG